MGDAFPVAKPASKAVNGQAVDVGKVIGFLIHDEKKTRPKTQAGLITHLTIHFTKQRLSVDHAKALVGEMLTTKRIAETAGKLTCNF